MIMNAMHVIKDTLIRLWGAIKNALSFFTSKKGKSVESENLLACQADLQATAPVKLHHYAYNTPNTGVDFDWLTGLVEEKDCIILDYDQTITVEHMNQFMGIISRTRKEPLSYLKDYYAECRDTDKNFMGDPVRRAAIVRFLEKLIETNSHLYIATFSKYYWLIEETLKLVCDEKDSTLWNDVQKRIHCDEGTSGRERWNGIVDDKEQHLAHILGQRDELRLTGKTVFCDDDSNNVEQSGTMGFEIIKAPSAAMY